MPPSRPALVVLLAGWVLVAAAPGRAQCGPGSGCTEYRGEGRRGAFFRILVPDRWDGDLVIFNHGLELDPLTIAPHETCRGAPTVRCTSNADCAGIGPGVCHRIGMLGLEQFLLPKGKAVGASTFSQTSWSAFASRFDLKDLVRFLHTWGPGKPRRIIMTGISGGGAVTVDATMHLKPGVMIHGAVPLCSCSGGGLPSMDAATDVRLVYDFLCDGVPGGRFASLPDVGDPTMSQIEFGLTVDACLGILAPSPDPAEAAAQAARRDAFFRMTKFSGTNLDVLTVLGFSVLAMGDFVDDPARLDGRRPGWNTDVDYTSVYPGPEGRAFDATVPRFGPGRGRRRMRNSTHVDFTRGVGKRVDYPMLSFSGRSDFICLPEFQKLYDDAATLGGKDHALVWGSRPGHCAFTPFELRAVFEEYFEWLDTYRTPHPDEPTTADVLARCLALPGASPAACAFDPAFTAPPLAARVPPRPDWPEAAKHPLP